jgi:hypothetical protein
VTGPYWKSQTLKPRVLLHSGNGTDSGVGTGCIKDPTTGDCGCENSDGTFVADSSSCV